MATTLRRDWSQKHHPKRESVMSLPAYITRTACFPGYSTLSNSTTTLDNISIHSDDVTTARDAHVSRLSGRGIFRKFSRAFQDRFSTKRYSLDSLTEALAINHADPEDIINRCASCSKLMTSQEILSRRISLASSKTLAQIDNDLMDYSGRDFTSHLSPISLSNGRVRFDTSLSNISQLPLLIVIENSHLLIYADGGRRHCAHCSRRRISVPYLLGQLNMPIYMNTSTVTLTFVQATDTLIIEGATTGLQTMTSQRATQQTAPKLIKIRSL